MTDWYYYNDAHWPGEWLFVAIIRPDVVDWCLTILFLSSTGGVLLQKVHAVLLWFYPNKELRQKESQSQTQSFTSKYFAQVVLLIPLLLRRRVAFSAYSVSIRLYIRYTIQFIIST